MNLQTLLIGLHREVTEMRGYGMSDVCIAMIVREIASQTVVLERNRVDAVLRNNPPPVYHLDEWVGALPST
jgi:hypothetical protein